MPIFLKVKTWAGVFVVSQIISKDFGKDVKHLRYCHLPIGMWAQCQTLADFQLYMCLSEDSDDVKQIQAFITRSFLDERKYVEEFYPEYNHQFSEDEASHVSDPAIDLTTSEVSSIAPEESVIGQETLETDLKLDQNKLSKRLSTLGLNNFDLSSSGDSDVGEFSGAVGGISEDIDSKQDRLQKYLEGAAALAQDPYSNRQSVENSIAEDPDSDGNSVENSIDDLAEESDSYRQSAENTTDEIEEWESSSMAEMMKSMGLPTSFGTQKKAKKRQPKVKAKISDKEMRKRFAAFWNEKGELIVYRSFVSSYPDYAGCYDQIAGCIPPGIEVEVGTQIQDNHKDIEDIPSNDVKDDIVTSTSNSGVDHTRNDQMNGQVSNMEKDNVSINDSNHEAIMNSGIAHHEYCADNSSDSHGDALDVKGNKIEAFQPSIGPDSTTDHNCGFPQVDSGQGSMTDTDPTPAVIHDPVMDEHGYSAGPSSTYSSSQYYNYNDTKESSEEGYSHEDLIAMLKELHHDMQNNIWWYVKEKFEEWTRENPDGDFDVSHLDNHLLAQNEEYAYASNQEVYTNDCYNSAQKGSVNSPSRNSVFEDEDVSEQASDQRKSIPETLELLGLTVNMDQGERQRTKRKIQHGTVIYKRKSIKKEAKRWKLDYGRAPRTSQDTTVLSDVLKARHIVFDDDDKPHAYGTEVPKSFEQNNGVDPYEPTVHAEISQESTKHKDNQVAAGGLQSSSSSCSPSEAGDEACSSPKEITVATGKKKRKAKNIAWRKSENIPCASHSPQSQKQHQDLSQHPVLAKYWYQRYHLFKKFDEGIKLDHESWFSVTPELTAAHIAERCRCDIIVDGFCGAGGNAIQFAITCNHVIAIDIDATKLELARHNAEIYGVADRITFIQGDFIKLAPTLKADVVFLSPPWGGPEYLNAQVYDIDSMGGFNAASLLKMARQISENIAFYIPRNADIEKVFALAEDGRIEVEENFLHTKLKTLTAYFGELLNFS